MRSDNRPSSRALFAAAILLLAAAALASLCVGRYPIAPSDLLRGGMARNVFWNLRLPRTLMVVMAGAGLSMAGGVLQTVFKNPLAAPDIIGVAGGANLGAAAAIVLWGAGGLTVAVSAFAGGLLAVFCALGLASRAGDRGTTGIVLAGIAINALAQAAIMTLKAFADPERQLAALEFWAMGSFGGVTAAKLAGVAPLFAAGLLGMFALRWPVQLLSLSDDEAASLGVRVGRTRCAVLIFATLTVASVVSVTGLIVFIGLVAPHIARLLRGRNNWGTTLLSGLVGAILLLLADCLARGLTAGEMPISILTSLLGAPFLAWLICRREGTP